jgi:hypothetical protein
MLWNATKEVTEHAECTLVVARHAEDALKKGALPRATALNLDYSDTTAFMSAVSDHIDLASIDLAVLWIRDNGLGTLFTLLERFANQSIRIVHIAGSAAGDPERQAKRIAEKVAFGADCHYCPVILGAMPSPDGRRWLTHAEICAGTIEAIRTGTPQMIGHALADLD